MKKILLLSAAILAVAACKPNDSRNNSPQENSQQAKIPAGFKLVESVTPKKGEIGIPYKKYVMDNGLTVILAPDHSDPLVHVDVTYHVGSAREEPGRSGFAHFFEHMMFQGSEHVADEQHFKLITESGGTLNGSTTGDRTNYYETVPNNQLEKVLWLEADRMGFLLPAVTKEKFENQRATVKNERGQRYDNRPYGLVREKVGEALYPEGHPYSWTTIGYIEDLNRADLDDLKRFFLRWYGPNNATLTIGGDFDEAQALKWVKKYFGPIPRGPEVTPPKYTPVSLPEDRYISYEDNVALPLLYMSWPTVHVFDKDEAPLDVLMNILGQGKTSLLYKNLVKPGKAVQAGANHGCAELGCTFTIFALPTPGHSLAEMEKIARQSLEEFETRGGATQDDIDRVKAGIVSDKIYGLESVSGKVSQLAMYQYLLGNPDYIAKDVKRYQNVTKDDVMRVYKKYIKGKHAVILSVVPKGHPEMVAHKDTWHMYERTIPEHGDEGALQLREPKDNFDRSVIPPAGPNPVIHVPPVYQTSLKNGIAITGAVNAEVPTTTIRLRIPAGQTREPLDKLGLASLTAGMLDEATEAHTAEELSNALQKLGSSVYFNSGDKYATLTIRALTENLDKTLAIAREKLGQPKFDGSDFERLQKQTIEGLKNNKKNASVTASNIYTGLLFGKNNSFAYDDSGTIATISKLSLADVKDFYKQAYGPKGADILVVSNLPQKDIVNKLSVFGDWQGGHKDIQPLKSYPKLSAGTLYFIDKPEAAQSEIRIGKRDLKYDATGEFYRATLMNYNLGGAFNSRINLNLREDKGYTYGARSFFYGTDFYGAWRAQAGVKASTTEDSIVQFRKEISNYQKNGMTADELAFLKNSLGQRDARAYETPRQKLGYLSNIATYNLKPDYVDEQNKILQNITLEELNALAKKHLKLDEMITVVVGDKKTQLPEVQKLGLPIVELDTDGNPVK